jgi:hypothetical protein
MIRLLCRARRVAGVLLAASLAAPAAAQASGLDVLGRNVRGATLKVNARGVALVEFTERGVRKHVLATGAINTGPGNTRFDLDYSGGWKSRRTRAATFRRAYWKTFRNACRRYDGPALNALVAACQAPDGSYWALQDWTRLKDEYGGTRTFRRGPAKRELRLSHWTGEIAKLDIVADWGWGGRWRHMFGRYTYRGAPVHGFRTDRWGNPLDDYGRNLYVDTLDGEGYPRGWSRVNSFVAHRPHGNFCFLFSPKADRPSFTGTADGWRHSGRSLAGRYKVSVVGPGVTPDLVDVPFGDAGPFDPTRNAELNELEKQYAVDPADSCWPAGSKG